MVLRDHRPGPRAHARGDFQESVIAYARKVDSNHGLIKLAFEQMGCTTMDIFRLGNNVPDILVGVCGIDQLVEVKSEDGECTDGQKKFHREWNGRSIRVVRTVKEAAIVVADMGAAGRRA